MKILKSFIAISLSCILVSNIYAQDKSSQAQNAYLQAEELFNNKNYNSALEQINAAENFLEKTNSKILYLKIQILNAQFSSSPAPYVPLKNALTQFFQITDKNNYPQEKYIEILRLQSDLSDFKRKDSIASQNLLADGSLTSLSAYINSTPNSLYYSQLNSKRAQEQAKADEVNRIVHQNKVNNRIAELNDKLIPRAKRKNTRHKILGSVLMAAGGVGIYYMISLDKKDQNSSFGDKSNTSSTYAVGIPSVAAEVLGIIMVIGGGNLRALKKERNDLIREKNSWAVTLSPYYNNAVRKGVFGLTCKMTF
jgi:hypothetical protein